MSAASFERFFREAAGLDVDKEDFRRYNDFVRQKVYDILLRGQAIAMANARQIIEPYDLPITKGLQETIHAFRTLDGSVREPILHEFTQQPPLDLPYSEETVAKIPEIAAGLSLALARTFKIVYPDLKNPQTVHWETALRIFNLLL